MIVRLLICISVSLSLPAFAADAPMRRELGQLVIEGIPDIPAALEARLQRYENVRGHRFDDFFPDGSILISTRFGETLQIHHVASPGAARRQLTFYDEPVAGAAASPTTPIFAFGKDTGGDEFYQGYAYDTRSGDIVHLTEPGTRNGSIAWRDDGELIAFSEARDADPDYTIKTVDPKDPETRRTLWEAEGATFAVDWSADGSELLAQRYVSLTKSHLYVIDASSGAVREVLPGEDSAYSGGELLAGGAVLTLTDYGSNFANLVLIGADGQVRDLTAAIEWDVEEFALSPDERTAAIVVNEDGLGTIRLVDIESGAVTPGPDLPPGIAYGLGWSRDGAKLGFTFNAANSPSDVYTYALAEGALERWTHAELGGLDTSGFVAPSLIRFPNADGMNIPAFIYRPEGEGPHPVIISIHGGPEGQARPYFSSTYQYWVSELGAAVIVPNVRGSTGYGQEYAAMDNGLNRKRSVEDIGALLDWIAAQPGLDEERVIVYGGSYGGYMVLASMVDYADRIAGGVDIVGISDFATFLTNTKGYRRDLRRAEYGDERDPEIAAFFDRISPLKNAGRITKPLFIIQGANDPRVPASEAEQILAAARKNETKTWYLLAKDEGHGFRKKANRDFQRGAVTLFLRDVLNLEQ